MSMARHLNPADLVAAALFAALAVFILVQPFVGREPRLSPGDPGPWLLPSVYGVGLLILSVALLVHSIRRKPVSDATLQAAKAFAAEHPEEAEATPASETAMLPKLAAVAVLSIAYVWTFANLGFYLTTGAFLFLAIVALGARSLRALGVAALVAVTTTAVVGLVLTHFLEVSLPAGSLF